MNPKFARSPASKEPRRKPWRPKIPRLGIALSVFMVSMVSAGGARSAELVAFADVFPGIFSPDVVPFPVDGGFGQTSAQADVVSTFGSSSFSANARANSSFGQLSTFASAMASNYAPQSFFQPCAFDPNVACGRLAAGADAGFNDTLTITGGTGDAYLGLGWDISGSSSASSTGGLQSFNLGVGGRLSLWAGPTFNAPDFQASFMSDTSLIGVLPFTFGDPLTLNARLSSRVNPFDFSAMSSYGFSGIAAFEDTAKLVSLRVFSDADLQNEIQDFDVLAASGTDYLRLNVPEPSTLALLFLGATLVAASRGPREPRRPSAR